MSGPLLAESRATLPSDARSPSAARRLVRRLLADADRTAWADAAELAVSEVVSNAVLHAHTEIVVTVQVTPEAVRVDVLDHSPLLPTQRSYGEHATTGRGLGLVAVLATRFGVETHEGDGKTIWFCIGDGAGGAEPDLDDWADAWDEAERAEGAAGAGAPAADVPAGDVPEQRLRPPEAGPREELGRAELRDLPTALWLAAQQHHDAIIREYVLAHVAEAEDGDASGDVPEGDPVLAADAAQGMLAAAVDRALEAAAEEGRATQALPAGHPSPLPSVPSRLDVVLTVRPDDVPAFAALQDALDAAEAMAARGRLLARPALPEVVAVRDWACEQVIAQLGGVAATPWPGMDSPRVRDVGPADDLPDADWDPMVVRTARSPVVAADESNRIVAASDSLGALVGWAPDDLVGRRIVVLIPPRLRELHVAGFTRHLTTGEAHVLGVPLQLPVLHADGHEVTCRFLVERVPETGARAVYLAWLSPLDDPAG